jgi:hypothetical protein
MPWELWKRLGEEGKIIWDSLTDQDKSIILGLSSQMSSPDNAETQRRSHQINLHNVTEDKERFHDTMQIPSQHVEGLDSTEVYVSQQQAPPTKHPPHDIRA